MAALRSRLMLGQLNKAVKEPNDYCKFWMTDDVNTWYILLSGFSGNDDEFTYVENGEQRYGEYLVKMVFPDKFPREEPPQFYLLTENGVYGVNKKVCISIGEYHKADYRPTLGAAGFAVELVNGMIGWKQLGGGIEILKSSVSEKRQLARASRNANAAHYPDMLDNIGRSFAEYSTKWDAKKMSADLRARLGMSADVLTSNTASPVTTPAAPPTTGTVAIDNASVVSTSRLMSKLEI